ncbi:flagellar basal-body MS-ring/collar protein FliF [Pseudooceanicola sp. C21-150M6]|uniref:flagellar basal-body MS-ring/collar protein FliF n=1 Tax=Pseudooceanicola sp. C21-150M6 TaxID=3434355 RepID=UPI003D7F6190
MQKVIDSVRDLGLGRNLFVGAAGFLVMLMSIIGIGQMAFQPEQSLLYSGLGDDVAGEVIGSLEQLGVAYDVSGGKIYVNAADRDELRMTLAGQGIPRSNTTGYELLDSLNGFGTTSQMFDVAYWRAKEGELARTISSIKQIHSARVHIARTGGSVMSRKAEPKASVYISETSSLNRSQVQAISFLVASAVSGLSPSDVAVVASNGELVSGFTKPGYLNIETDRADKMRDQITRLLEARVGLGNAVVEVSVDTNSDTETIVEKSFDPDGRVAISTDTEEASGNSSDGGEGVGVSSNLPNGDTGTNGRSSNQTNRTRERVNYEVAETARELIRGPGDIRRISVAVLVNGEESLENDELVIKPRAEEELATLRELVASAVGFNAERGDELTVKSLVFSEFEPRGTISDQSWFELSSFELFHLMKIIALGAIVLLVGIFVVRPAVTPKIQEISQLSPPSPAETDVSEQPSAQDTSDDDFSLPGLTVVSDFDIDGVPGFEDGSNIDPLDRLQNLMVERSDETTEILREWLESREGTA